MTATNEAPSGTEPVTMMDFFMHLDYREPLAPVMVHYAETLEDGRIIGHRCPQCGLVYVPPRGYCPICVVETGDADELTLADTGVVTNYTIITPVQYYGQQETEPFAKASVLLDGGGILSLQDVVDCPVEQVRVGMRVAAVWVPAEARTTAEMTNRSAGSAEGCIRGFRPTGEPDLPPEEFVDKVV